MRQKKKVFVFFKKRKRNISNTVVFTGQTQNYTSNFQLPCVLFQLLLMVNGGTSYLTERVLYGHAKGYIQFGSASETIIIIKYN